jgi:biopolymer transport protein ExbD
MLAILSVLTADLVPEQRRQPPLDLPKAQTAAPQPLAPRDDAMLVSVTRDGGILLGNYEVSLEVPQHRIETALREGSEKALLVGRRACKIRRYGDDAKRSPNGSDQRCGACVVEPLTPAPCRNYFTGLPEWK